MLCRPTRKGSKIPFQLELCLIVLVTCCLQASAQRELRIEQWTTDHGLPQDRPSCFKQTRDGYLWMGTYYGLARFNGMDFTVFNRFNTPELQEDTIAALSEAENGTLWIGTAEGLVRYRDHTFTQVQGLEDLPKRIWRMSASRYGGVWVQASGSVFRIEEDGKRSNVTEFHLPRLKLWHLEEDNDGWLNVLTECSWVTISSNGTQVITNLVRETSAGRWTCGKLSSEPGVLWAAGPGFCQLLTKEGAKHIPRNGRDHIPVTAICEDKGTNIWIGDLEGKIYVLEYNQWKKIHDGKSETYDLSWKEIDLGEGGKSAEIIAIQQDQEGSFWVGTTRGLFQIQERRVRTFTPESGLPTNYVHSVCEDSNRVIWAGTMQGICRIRNDKIDPLESEEPFISLRDRCVCPNGKGGLFFAKDRRGLYEFQDGQFTLVAELTAPAPIGALYRDRSGVLWIGSSTNVLMYKEGKITPLAARYPINDARCILKDTNDYLWIGTRTDGVIRVCGDDYTQFKEEHGLANNSVWAIHEDSSGSLWFGTENGLARWKNGKFFKFHREHGVGDSFMYRRGVNRSQLVINCILEDNAGFLWLSGLRGIFRIPREQLDAVAEERLTEVGCAIINRADGMISSETNGERQPAGWKAQDGRLWFPTILGLVVIDPANFDTNPIAPFVLVQQVFAHEEPVYGDFAKAKSPDENPHPNRILLPPGHAQLVEFHFTANTLIDSKHVRFRYRLRNLNERWKAMSTETRWGAITTERIARYTNLRPGNYAFEVTAADNNGTWNPEPATVEISVAPHFWETRTFYILCGLAVVGLAAAIQAYRLRWQRRILKLEQQRALANERARIARDLHDDLGTALTGLALELDVAGRAAKTDSGMTERLNQTAEHTRQMAERMREVVWSVNPKCDTLSSLAGFLEQQVSQFLRNDTISARVEFPENIPPLSLGADARHQLALSVREALTNVVRHANATEVILRLALNQDHLLVQVKDNGKGFRLGTPNGHGLENMKSRLSQIGGSFECMSDERTGTIVSFRVPLPELSHENNQFYSKGDKK
jgi:signal transduction histidine kinase/ligand-binding sensor domain-containing protein